MSLLTLAAVMTGCGKESAVPTAQMEVDSSAEATEAPAPTQAPPDQETLNNLYGERALMMMMEHEGDIYMTSQPIPGAVAEDNLIAYYDLGNVRMFEIWTYYNGVVMKAGQISTDNSSEIYIDPNTGDPVYFEWDTWTSYRIEVVNGILNTVSYDGDYEKFVDIDWKYGEDYPG